MKTIRVSEAAALTGLSENTLRKYADIGFLPCVRMGGQRRFRVSDLEALATRGTPAPDRRREPSRRGRGVAILRELQNSHG